MSTNILSQVNQFSVGSRLANRAPSEPQHHDGAGKPSYKFKTGYTVFEEANFYIEARYSIQQVLGKGSYGTVCSAVDTAVKDRPVLLAIKKVCNIFNKEVLLKRACRELKLMRYFKGHKNIINLIDADMVMVTPYDGLYCFQELADYDLARVIHSSVQFSEFHIKSFFYQILCGLKYIHSADVIHRDLKPGNILVTIQGVLKICDFGLARGVSPKYLKPKPHSITNYVATRWYRAPELLLSKKTYNKSVDMWAVGCILAELYARRPLFIGDDQMHQATEILKILGTPSREIILKYGSSIAWQLLCPPNPQFKPVPWSEVLPFASSNSHHLLSKLLCWDTNHRFTVEQALNHDFLSSIKSLNGEEEPVCNRPFDFSFENVNFTLNDYKSLLHEEVRSLKLEKLGHF